jgi:hypothetical protein
MLVRNYPALFEMALSLSLQTTDEEKSEYHFAKAVELMKTELEQNQGGHRAFIQIQGPGFAMGEIGSLV